MQGRAESGVLPGKRRSGAERGEPATSTSGVQPCEADGQQLHGRIEAGVECKLWN